MITKLKLHNFKSFNGDVTVPLGTKLTCVVGSNGSGKSNLVDAFCFGLCVDGVVRGKARDVISMGEDTCWVEVVVGTSVLHRGVSARGKNCYKINGKVMKTKAAYLEGIHSATGVNPASPDRYVITQQNTARLVTEGSQHLLHHVDLLAGNPPILTQIHNINESIEASEGLLKTAESRFSTLSVEKNRILELRWVWEVVEAAENEFLKLKTTHGDLREMLRDVKTARVHDEVAGKTEEIRRITAERREISTAVGDAERQLSVKRKEAAGNRRSLAGSTREKRRIVGVIRDHKKKIDTAKTCVVSLNVLLSELRRGDDDGDGAKTPPCRLDVVRSLQDAEIELIKGIDAKRVLCVPPRLCPPVQDVTTPHARLQKYPWAKAVGVVVTSPGQTQLKKNTQYASVLSRLDVFLGGENGVDAIVHAPGSRFTHPVFRACREQKLRVTVDAGKAEKNMNPQRRGTKHCTPVVNYIIQSTVQSPLSTVMLDENPRGDIEEAHNLYMFHQSPIVLPSGTAVTSQGEYLHLGMVFEPPRVQPPAEPDVMKKSRRELFLDERELARVRVELEKAKTAAQGRGLCEARSAEYIEKLVEEAARKIRKAEEDIMSSNSIVGEHQQKLVELNAKIISLTHSAEAADSRTEELTQCAASMRPTLTKLILKEEQIEADVEELKENPLIKNSCPTRKLKKKLPEESVLLRRAEAVTEDLAVKRSKISQLLLEVDGKMDNGREILEAAAAVEIEVASLKRKVEVLQEERRGLQLERSTKLKKAIFSINSHVAKLLDLSRTADLAVTLTQTPSGVHLTAHPRPLSMLSGGQRSFLSVILALSFAEAFSHTTPFLILDEADAALDAHYAQKLAMLLPQCKPAVVCVTLREYLYKHATRLVGVHKTGEGGSRVVTQVF